MSTTPAEREDFLWEESLPFVLWRTQNAVHRSVQGALEGLGVTVTQLGLAVHLQKLGPLSASDLSRGYRITPQSVATALAHLDKMGWVERRPHPVHGRVVLYTISDAGLTGVREGSVRMADVTGRISSVLSADATAAVTAGLGGILAELEGTDQPMQQLWPIRPS